MRNWLNLIIAVVAVVTATSTIPAYGIDKTVTVTIYYQFTADASTFIRQQLFPTYVHINRDRVKRLTVELVPYQNVNCESDPPEYFVWECLNDKLHACAASVLPSDWARLNFLHCISDGEKQGYHRASACAVETCVDDTPIAFCMNSVDGDEFLAENVNRTRALGVEMNSHPIVAVDGVVLQGMEEVLARENLLAALCARYTTKLAGRCGKARAVKTMRHHNYGTYFFYPIRPRCDV